MDWKEREKPGDKSGHWTDSVSSMYLAPRLAFSYLTSPSIDAFFWKPDSVKS